MKMYIASSIDCIDVNTYGVKLNINPYMLLKGGFSETASTFLDEMIGAKYLSLLEKI